VSAQNMVIMLLEMVILLLILAITEFKSKPCLCCSSLRTDELTQCPSSHDIDVTNEFEYAQSAIESINNKRSSREYHLEQQLMNLKIPLAIYNLHKIFDAEVVGDCKGHHAVKGLPLDCTEGERIGLLGINGAGKSTTLGILTAEIFATAGEVYIGGKPLSDPTTQQMLGYCPQVDPLLELMNAYETLWFFTSYSRD
jgi:ABC-type multidrug transport system fused ATPase/permease subunit